MNSINRETDLSTQSEDEEFSPRVQLSPRLSLSTDEEYLKAILLSRLIKNIFCASGLSKINAPTESTNPFKPHFHLRNVKIKTKSKDVIRAWVVYNTEKTVKKWALVLHGNSTNRNTFSRLYNVESMIEEGIGALIVDYRGFGDSEGTPSKTAFIEDVSACIQYFKKKHIFSISIVSYSLGTAIALEYLVEYAKRKKNAVIIEKLVLVSPFVSTLDLLREYKLWNLLEMAIPDSCSYAMHGLGYDSLENIKKVEIKTLIIHGSSDWLIPCHHGERLAKDSDATFLKIENESHGTIFKNPVTWKTIVRFIEN
ncbi:uncharacterized protein NEMIN01_0451 [Nematocida minor]|uniref:uncharacterized protein n=1 Tax=Nematocida minor TaxID=1912983 RepID=UPI00221F169F|nr:uncharacterized protein NEMIN01_0451 [Nematocida minor]KAI5189388.1 uncharacterized protein NEMIN01_0451 [Nematocida minor]